MLLTALGIIVYSFFAVIGGITIWMNKNPDKVADMLEEEGINSNENVELSPEEFLALVDEVGTSGWIVLSGAILAIILDRKSTRLNSSHVANSYAVSCLKKNVTNMLYAADKSIQYVIMK